MSSKKKKSGAILVGSTLYPRPKATKPPPIEEKKVPDKVLRKRIWASFNGCDCPNSIPAKERCTVKWIRCRGRLDAIYKALDKAGLHRFDPPLEKR